ncbi:AraC-like DNA-binding protein [Salirhabdus euzebyi]|uniref:AraC-like DNA-binding protein n=2 Tax=Salirhabdus euzebyi TaxID=394506 RepID=A0A841Q4R6_9BACI|nr:AraC-like DNA-binding protein [Salirhabdus euzebyi]
MIIMESRLKNMVLGIYELGNKTADDMHGHGSMYQVSIPVYGNPHMQFNDQHKNLMKYDVTVVSPGDQHRNFADKEKIRLMLVSVDQAFFNTVFSEITGEKKLIEFMPWGHANGEGIIKQVDQFFKRTLLSPVEEVELEDFEHSIAEKILTIQKGSHSSKWDRDHISIQQPIIKLVLEFIHDHYDKPLTLQILSTATGISKTHLNRLFRQELGKSISDYINHIRTKKAEQLMKGKQFTLTEIAFESGFGSISTFERAFQKYYGMTPSQYKKIVTF